MNTSYFDNLTDVVRHVQDWDELPDNLLPLVISSQAILHSGYEAGHSGHAAW